MICYTMDRNDVGPTQCVKAFDEAKKFTVSEMVLLTHYNASLPTKLSHDTSPYGIGTIMSHRIADHMERLNAFTPTSLTFEE